VTFFSPGTFVSETTSKEIGEWDTRMAIAMAERIVERHGAIPYGFRFETVRVGTTVDPDGAEVAVAPKTLNTSGYYYIEGKLVTLDDVEARNDPSERILRDNMRYNRYPVIVETRRGYLHTRQFEHEDVIVDAAGNVTRRGDDAELVAYRAERIARDKSDEQRALEKRR